MNTAANQAWKPRSIGHISDDGLWQFPCHLCDEQMPDSDALLTHLALAHNAIVRAVHLVLDVDHHHNCVACGAPIILKRPAKRPPACDQPECRKVRALVEQGAPPCEPGDRYLGIHQVADYLGINSDRVRQAIRSGALPHYMWGRSPRVRLSELREYVGPNFLSAFDSSR